MKVSTLIELLQHENPNARVLVTLNHDVMPHRCPLYPEWGMFRPIRVTGPSPKAAVHILCGHHDPHLNATVK